MLVELYSRSQILVVLGRGKLRRFKEFTQAIFVAATQCNFCRAEVVTSKLHV